MTANDWPTSHNLDAMLDAAEPRMTDLQSMDLIENCLEAFQSDVVGASILLTNLRRARGNDVRGPTTQGVFGIFGDLIRSGLGTMLQSLVSGPNTRMFPIVRLTLEQIRTSRRSRDLQPTQPNEIRLTPIEPIWDRELCELLRDIIRNPLCDPPPFDPMWRNETVSGIYYRIKHENHYAAMPILADALEDVGCDDEELLLHLREFRLSCYPTPHAQGCWALATIAPPKLG